MNLEQLPYVSRRSPVFASNGVVATSHPLAARAGLRMLEHGGNAVDAALATAVALTVLEPTSNGIGGDAFAIVWDGSRLHGLNGSGRWPMAQSAARYRDQGHAALPELGWPTVTVPGAPDAWRALHERFGSLDMAEVMAPAIAYAEEGFPVPPVIAALWRAAAETYLPANLPEIADWAEVFASNGRAPATGSWWRGPGHARCLRTMLERGIRDFYEGGLAERLVEYSTATGGAFALSDLGSHESEWVEPVSKAYRDHEIWEIPPNGQGIAALVALGLLDGLPPADSPPPSEIGWHRQIEAMKLAFADVYRYVADPDHVPVPVEGLLDSGYLSERRQHIGEQAGTPEPGSPPKGGTVYLCAADRDGMMVSYIQSNYMGFGSGVVVPDIGVALHNRGAGFVLTPGHPNEAAPGKRPRHTIIPAFLTRGGEAVGPFGVMGAEMQPQGHVQIITGMLDHGLNPQAALDLPRWRVEGGTDVLVEAAADPAVVEALRARGHRVTVSRESSPFGRGQIIMRLDEGGYVAGSEPRADGAAVGY